MVKPGSAGLAVLLQSYDLQVDVGTIEKTMLGMGWNEDHDYQYNDWLALGVKLGYVTT